MLIVCIRDRIRINNISSEYVAIGKILNSSVL